MSKKNSKHPESHDKDNQKTNKSIYNRLYVGGDEFPVFLWFSEHYDENHDPGREQARHWMGQWGNRELRPDEIDTIPVIMMSLRDLVENILQSLKSGKEPKDVIHTYYISTIVNIPLDESKPTEAHYSSFVSCVGESVKRVLSNISDIARKNPLLSSWIATEIMGGITDELSRLRGTSISNIGRPCEPEA